MPPPLPKRPDGSLDWPAIMADDAPRLRAAVEAARRLSPHELDLFLADYCTSASAPRFRPLGSESGG